MINACSCYLLFTIILMLIVVGVVLFANKETMKRNPTTLSPPPSPLVHFQSTAYSRRLLSGIPKEYTPIGYIHQEFDTETMFPLYGRASRTNVSRWNYHTITDRLSNIRLPIESMDGRDCTLDMGCNELFDGDQVKVRGLPGVFTVRIYHKDFLR